MIKIFALVVEHMQNPADTKMHTTPPQFIKIASQSLDYDSQKVK